MVCLVFVFCAATTMASPAQTLSTVVSFNGASGANPQSPLIQATDGNFYGTTLQGGATNNGTIFKITPTGTLTTLYSFGGADGSGPYAGLLQASDGNFYGTTSEGGANNKGTVFTITSSGTLTTLYNFCSQANCTDGAVPWAGLLQASDGNLYGTTIDGGSSANCLQGCGTAFKITTGGALTTLHAFDSTDGATPFAGLVQATDGNFYGTTALGGANCLSGGGCGTVFAMTPAGALTTLYSFCPQSGCADGSGPYAGLVQATDGNFYGTTPNGGTHAKGTVFAITPGGMLTTLHSFGGSDGAYPEGGLIQANHGNFYGSTSSGGGNGDGTLFAITTGGALTTLHSFDGTDGATPLAALLQASDGSFYGTTVYGGTSTNCSLGCGTVFRLSLPLVPTMTSLVSTPNPSYQGEPVTMTATVTAQDGSTPTGTVVFNSNGVQVGSAQLNGSGVAVLIYAGLPVGTDSLTAMYQGSGTLAGSTSNPVMQVVMLASTTSVTSSPNPSMVGEEVTLTATVGPAGPPMPTGTVSFTSNGTAISGCTSVPLGSSLTAVCITSTLAVGTDAIVATYSGDSNYAGSSGMLSQIVNPLPVGVQFVPVTPCRLYDTRPSHGGSGPIQGGTTMPFNLPQLAQAGPCAMTGLDLSSAAAYSLNITVIPRGTLGYLTLWPTGEGRPTVSTLNSVDGRVKANAAITPAGTGGAVNVYVTNTTDVVIDIDGYFAPTGTQTLAFYPLPPCRVADTRHDTYPMLLGPPALIANEQRSFPVLDSSCIPPGINPQAYSFNFTVVPTNPVGYLSVWPTGQSQPVVSTLNDQTGTIVANAAIVPAGTGGAISVFSTDNTQLLIDINGYFAAQGAGGLSLYALTPCRTLDTRRTGSGQPFSGKLAVDIVDGPCGPPATAQAYVFNATVVPVGPLGYLALWPDQEQQPVVSTLNAVDGAITNNMAIVPTNNGSIDAYAGDGLTQLLLDLSSYFAP
jgi:uncharacterized repeat protein (TIGR03803 family)